MTKMEVVTTNLRSEGAKRMWERRKAKEKENMSTAVNGNGSTFYPIKPWIFQVQWWTLVGGMAGTFVFFFTAFSQMNHRLDDHIKLSAQMNSDTNKRLDDHMEAINRRSDDLHKEFYALLKEIKK